VIFACIGVGAKGDAWTCVDRLAGEVEHDGADLDLKVLGSDLL